MPRLGLQATSLPDLVNFNLICQSAVSRKAGCIEGVAGGGGDTRGKGEGGGTERKEWRPHRFLIKLETEVAINHYYLEKLKPAGENVCCVSRLSCAYAHAFPPT